MDHSGSSGYHAKPQKLVMNDDSLSIEFVLSSFAVIGWAVYVDDSGPNGSRAKPHILIEIQAILSIELLTTRCADEWHRTS